MYAAKKRAVMGDGGNWIEPLGQMHFPGWLHILDFLHLLVHLYAAARLALVKNPRAAWNLYEQMLRDAWGGKVQAVIDALREQAKRLRGDSSAGDRCRVAELALAYVERNRERMDYPRYRRMGLPVSSAPVESLIKQINHRVKGSEQFWNRGGLEAVLQVRAAYLSQDGRAEEFHERRRAAPPSAATAPSYASVLADAQRRSWTRQRVVTRYHCRLFVRGLVGSRAEGAVCSCLRAGSPGKESVMSFLSLRRLHRVLRSAVHSVLARYRSTDSRVRFLPHECSEPLESRRLLSAPVISSIGVNNADDEITARQIAWGDGSYSCPSAYDSSASHTFDSGSYTVVFSVTDCEGTYNANGVSVNVSSAAPTLSLSDSGSPDEGSCYTLSLSGYWDGIDSLNGACVSWGDSCSFCDSASGSNYSNSLQHTYPADGTYQLSATLTDNGGDSVTVTRDVTVNNVTPVLTISGSNSVDEGAQTCFTFSATEPGTNDTIRQWVIYYGDGASASLTGNPAYDYHAYDAYYSQYQITAHAVTDGGTYDATYNVSVTNLPPTVCISGADSVSEGSTYTLNLSAADPGGDGPLTYCIQWGDGASQTLHDSPGSIGHIYADNSSYGYSLQVTVTDAYGASAYASRTVVVNDVAPTLGAGGPSTVPEGSSYPLDLCWYDPGADTLTFGINWGDGSDTQTVSGDVGRVYHRFNSAFGSRESPIRHRSCVIETRRGSGAFYCHRFIAHRFRQRRCNGQALMPLDPPGSRTAARKAKRSGYASGFRPIAG